MARSESPKPSSPMPVPPGTRECEYALRFGPCRVKAGESVSLRVVCSDRFWPDRWLASPDVREKFVMDYLTVGLTSDMSITWQRGTECPVQGEILAAWLTKRKSIDPGHLVTMGVTNIGKVDATFQCCLMGKAMVKIREKGTAPTYLDRTKTPRFSRRRR